MIGRRLWRRGGHAHPSSQVTLTFPGNMLQPGKKDLEWPELCAAATACRTNAGGRRRQTSGPCAAGAAFDLAIIGGGLTGLRARLRHRRRGRGAAGRPGRAAAARGDGSAAVRRPRDGDRPGLQAAARGDRRLAGAGGRGEPIRDIRVGERHSPLTVHYDHRSVGDQPLGHIVENRLIRGALLRRAGAADGGPLTPRPTRAGPGPGAGLAGGRAPARRRRAAPRAAAGRRRRGPLVPTRAAAGIEVLRWDYRQTGIVATHRPRAPASGLAVERFFPDGPLAFLPMTGRR